MNLNTPLEVAKNIAKQAQLKRLSLNLSQKSVAERSGVSLSSLKIFERTGKISLESILKIALVLGSLEEFEPLFREDAAKMPNSLDELLKNNLRKRGRK